MKEYNGYLLVEVPEGSKDFDLPEQDYGVILQYKHNKRWNSQTLPEGNYSIIGLLSEIAEKDLPEDVWQEIAKYISEKRLSINNCLILKKIL